MDLEKAISQFLGIQDVIIEDVKLFKKDLRAVITLRHDRAQCYCHHCGLQLSGVHEWIFKELKATPLGIFSDVKIKFWQLRGYCDDCDKIILAEAHWIHPKFPSMTTAFAEVSGRLMEEITCEAVGRILHCNSKTLWSLDQYRMALMMKSLKLPKDINTSYLCADEVHFKTIRLRERKGLFAKRYQAKFITNLVCPAESKVLFNGPGRDGKALQTAMSILSPGQLLAVEKFAVDMHEAFISVIKQKCPNAEVVIDRFHLAQKINEAFDRLRKTEFRKAKENKNNLVTDMLQPHRRFILMSRDADLSKSEMKLIDKLRLANKEINCGMYLVEYFHKALDQKKVPEFRKVLARWYQLCRNTRLEPFLKFAKTLRKYRKNIEAYIKSRLTTAVIEGLNNKIKVLRRMGYGYSNETSYMRKILQRCGYLNHLSINTDEFFYRIPNP